MSGKKLRSLATPYAHNYRLRQPRATCEITFRDSSAPSATPFSKSPSTRQLTPSHNASAAMKTEEPSHYCRRIFSARSTMSKKSTHQSIFLILAIDPSEFDSG